MRGLPFPSWDPTAATLYSESIPYDAVWSSCNRFIAVIECKSVVILDAATLSRVDTFAITSQYLEDEHWLPSFSPDGRCLTLIGRCNLISWDLQTGGPLGAIPSGLQRVAYSYPNAFSSTYSEDGKVVAAAYSARNFLDRDFDTYNTCIRTYDLFGTEAGPRCTPKGRIIEPIWTHGKCVRFVTINPGSVAVSEVEFTLKNPPVEVELLPIADKITGGDHFLFLPSLSRLAFLLRDTIQVWDAKAAKLLLKSKLPAFNFYSTYRPIGSFSSNGHFFAHVDVNKAARVWKESSTGYVLHQKLPFVTSLHSIQPRLSPSGESIILSPDRRAFHLWHTRDKVPSLPRISENDFTVAFSPDERFAAFARWQEGNMVTVFNPQTGDLQLDVDTDMRIVCLGMTGSTLIVVGEEKIVTWNLPRGNRALNASINNSARTTMLHRNQGTPERGSISPDFTRIAVLSRSHHETYLQIYDVSTGRCLASTWGTHLWWVGFTWDGRGLWTASYLLDRGEGWKIIEDSGSGPIQLEPQYGIVRPSGVFPTKSQVTGGY